MRQKLDYVHANPVKRGYVNWRYSSAANYEGLAGLMAIDVWGASGAALPRGAWE